MGGQRRVHLPVDAQGNLRGLHTEADGHQDHDGGAHGGGKGGEALGHAREPAGAGAGYDEPDAEEQEARARHVEQEVLEAFPQRFGRASCAMAKYRAHELMISQKVKKLNRSELAATPSSPPVMSRKKA